MIKKHFLQQIFGAMILAGFFTATFVSAADLTSTSFIVRDPLVGTGGSYGTSAGFSAFGSGDMTMIGSGTSTNFEGRYGFLWYPYVTQGAFTATPNGSQADLAWGASTAGLGWNVSGYKTGIASVSGGPYTYTTHGLVTNYTYSSLTPGLYCFVLQTLDAFSNVIATSDEECITITPAISFTISDNSIFFGNIKTASVCFAQGTDPGLSACQGTEAPESFNMTASSNAPSGYSITAQGATLTSGGNTITPLAVNTASFPGNEQFGIRISATGGSGTVLAPFAASGFAWTPTASTAVIVANTSAPSTTTTYSVREMANISSLTEAGTYTASQTYVITGTF